MPKTRTDRPPPKAAAPRPAPPPDAPEQLELELVRFGPGDRALDLRVDLRAETVWATRGEMADLFGVAAATVARQLDILAGEGGLGAVRPGGAGTGELHDLDTILCIGYRVNSAKAGAFRRWVGRMLRASAVDGFALDEARLRAEPAAADRLAARLRALRADESNIYETVRDFFREATADYDAASAAAAQFQASLRDKFIYAVTGRSASDLILGRARHEVPNMGLQSFAGDVPSMDEARLAANYLDRDELYALHIVCEQFLLYVQGRAARGRAMTMRELGAKLDDLLRLDDFPVLPGHKDVHRDRAVRHAGAEYARFILRETTRTRARPGRGGGAPLPGAKTAD